MLVKKIKESWKPKEKEDLQVGEVIDITDPRDLLASGAVILVDEQGQDKAKVEVIQCPVCNFETKNLIKYQEHLGTHTKKKDLEKGKTYQCPKCDFVADKPIVLASHVRREHAQ